MKKSTRIFLLVGILAGLATIVINGCSLVGANPSAPNKVERYLFDIQTNIVARTVYRTNESNVTNYVTLYETNEVGHIVTRTNEVIDKQYELVTATNWVEQFVLKDKESTAAGVQTAGSLLNMAMPGAGGLFVGIATGALALWRKLRSAKAETAVAQETGGVLAQNVQAVREFMKTIPGGMQYDDAVKKFLSEHQREAGVADVVANLLKNVVSTKDARDSVSDIQRILQSLRTPEIPPASVTIA